jgi:hypothetical protein
MRPRVPLVVTLNNVNKCTSGKLAMGHAIQTFNDLHYSCWFTDYQSFGDHSRNFAEVNSTFGRKSDNM